jgi:glycosyltransferase involved in cell wall biosynthesis
VIYGSLDTLSGGYLYDRMLVRQLQAEGHQVEIFSLPWRDYARHLVDNINAGWLRRIAAAKVDIWIQDELNHPSLLLANRRKRLWPVVSLVHHLRSSEIDHPPLLRLLYREVERLYLNSVDAFLCNSHTTQASVEQLLGQRKPSCVAYPAADHLPAPALAITLADLAVRSQQAGPLRLLFVGNVIQRKGLHNILAALAILSSDIWQLSIVGKMDAANDYAKIIQQQASRLPAGAVTFYGRLDDEQLAQQYRRHHLFVLPSYEGFGIVYLEAMRFGLPVIAATAGAAQEIVTAGENGFLVNPGDAAALAGHVRDLHGNRERLLAMSYAAHRRYFQHPTWQQSMTAASAWLASLPQSKS